LAPPFSEAFVDSGMSDTIGDGKFVELTYTVTDKKSGHVLTCVEFPLGYVHGHNEILAPFVHSKLEGKSAGDVIDVPIDGNLIYGARDESLVFTDRIENVPEEFRKVGTSILMENESGQTRSFLVTRMDDKTLTVDGNNPLCGREVVFTLEVLTVRDATDEERRAGGATVAGPEVDPSLMRPMAKVDSKAKVPDGKTTYYVTRQKKPNEKGFVGYETIWEKFQTEVPYETPKKP
jgi:FKBP-type peptidyl-prolyl cis-trans isomerase SlyD